jgi:hypothetical protein
MASEIDIFLAEKKIGADFSSRLQRNLRSSISTLTKKKSGLALKSKVKVNYKNGFLYSFTIFTPYYIYPILHYGFEGNKRKGINYRIKARSIITDALENGRYTEELADAVGNKRAVSIMNKIAFGFDKSLETSISLK